MKQNQNVKFDQCFVKCVISLTIDHGFTIARILVFSDFLVVGFEPPTRLKKNNRHVPKTIVQFGDWTSLPILGH